jgi:serine/threonine-protein kinase
VLAGGVPPDPRHDLYAVGRLALTMLAGAESDDHGTGLIGSIRDPVLRSAVDALLRFEPDERPPDAAAATALLDGACATLGPRSRDGDRIDVLDQLPALPPGWGPSGPQTAAGRAASASAPRATIVDVVATAPMRTATPDPAGDASPPPVPPQTRGPNAPALPSAPPGREASDSRRSTGRRKPVVVALAALAVMVLAGVIVALRLSVDTPPTGPTETPSVTSSGTTGASQAPATTTGTTDSELPATAPTELSPTVTTVPTTARVQAGDACGWQQEGDRRSGVDGPVVCALVDGSYQWRPSG